MQSVNTISGADVPPAPTQAARSIKGLPYKLQIAASIYLPPQDLGSLAQVSSRFYSVSAGILQTNFNCTVTLSYLNGIGIRNLVTATAIQKKELTLIAALKERSARREKIALLLQNPQLDCMAELALKSPAVSDFIIDGTLDLNEALEFDLQAIENLESPGVQKYIANRLLSIEEASLLDEDQRRVFESPAIQKYIDNGTLSLGDVLRMDEYGRLAVENEMAQLLVDCGERDLLEIIDQGQKGLPM